MKSEKQMEVYKRDNLIADIIFQHKGKENAIGIRELALALREKGYKVQDDHIHIIVIKIIFDKRLPICSNVHYGYYWATNKKDIQFAIDELKNKIGSLQERIELLESFIYEEKGDQENA